MLLLMRLLSVGLLLFLNGLIFHLPISRALLRFITLLIHAFLHVKICLGLLGHHFRHTLLSILGFLLLLLFELHDELDLGVFLGLRYFVLRITPLCH